MNTTALLIIVGTPLAIIAGVTIWNIFRNPARFTAVDDDMNLVINYHPQSSNTGPAGRSDDDGRLDVGRAQYDQIYAHENGLDFQSRSDDD